MANVLTQSSGQLAVSAGIQAIPSGAFQNNKRPGYLHIVLINPAAAASTITIYDNFNAASGTILAVVTSTPNLSNYVDYNGRRVFVNGLFCVITGAAATAEVTWE